MYVPFAGLFVPFGIYLTRFVSFKFRYGFIGTLSCLLVLLAVGYHLITPEWLRMKASYIAIFSILLPDSPNPESDILALNLKPEWIRFIGTTPYDADGPVETDAEFRKEFTSRVRTITIPKFLLQRPAQLYKVASEIAPQLVTTLPAYAGYYEESSEKPPRAKPPAPWSRIRARLFPASLWLLILYFVSGVVAFGMSFRSQLKEFMRGTLLLYSLLVAFGAIIFLLPIVTMAWIDTRYSITFVSAFDLAAILATGMLLQWVISLKEKSN
jgi:hypothetical protein